jgi:RNA polymerase sigma-70 factor, ECF subfamily
MQLGEGGMQRSEATDSAGRDDVIDVELTEFVREHYTRLARLAGLICREPGDAADAVQNGLEHAWRRRADLRDRVAMRSWLDRTVVREAIRLQRPRRSLFTPFDGPREIAMAQEVTDPRVRYEVDTELRIAFDALGSDQRIALVLHLYAGYTVEETADIVKAPIETVRARLRRGRERLRELLGDAR